MAYLSDIEIAQSTKMQPITEIAKIAGVEKASVNFMMQKLTLEAQEADFPRILDEADKAIRKVEPDCRLIRK